jgi:hypothetical protein
MIIFSEYSFGKVIHHFYDFDVSQTAGDSGTTQTNK